jgi:hypothetical protein
MSTNPGRIRIKTIALPTEHGAWGFLLEPILLAMLIAPTLAGVCYAVAAAAAFLSRHPLKLALKHRNEVGRSRRIQIAVQFAAGYGAVAGAGVVAAVFLAGWKPMLPMILLSPFILVFLFYDTKNRGRNLLPEIAGPLGLAATAPSIALAAGWSWPPASALWIVLMARTLPSIFYIRTRLRLERTQPTRRTIVFFIHVVFASVIALLVWRGLSPITSLLAFAILAIRAAIGLSSHRRLTRARQIGFLEIAFGLLYVLLVAVGYLFAPSPISGRL